MKSHQEYEEEAARIYAQGLQLIKEGDRALADAFAAQQKSAEALEPLLLQRQAIACQREGLALIDAATAMRCEAVRMRQEASHASVLADEH